MRKLGWIILVSGTILAGASAGAQTYDPSYPICMQVVTWGGGMYYECSFITMAQCAASASGRGAQCMANPYFAGFRGKGRHY